MATYSNAAEFYADRGVRSLVSSWTVSEGSQIVGLFGATVYNYSLNFTNSNGTVWNAITAGQGLPFGTQDTWINSLDSSRNINVDAVGDVNMSVTLSWTANAANDDSAWADGVSDAYKEYLRTEYTKGFGDFSQTVYGDQPELNGGVIQMVAYDVTDLLKAMGSEYADIENAFMFAWENWNWGTEFGKAHNTFDYNDMVYIMTNVTPNTATPEPATMLIFGLGIAGLGLARRRRK